MAGALRLSAGALLLAVPTVLAFFSGGYFAGPRLIAGAVTWALVIAAAWLVPQAWLRQRPLNYLGFEGTGHQVRDCLHPLDLVPALLKQMTAPVSRYEMLSTL